MKTFFLFLFENDSEFSKPTHKEHDLWTHGVPAVRDRETDKIYRGKRGQSHDEIKGQPDKPHDSAFSKGKGHLERGIWHSQNKTFHKIGRDTNIDSLDLMSNVQRNRWWERRHEH